MKNPNVILEIILDWTLGICMISIVLILFVGVIARYVFNAPIFGTEEVSVMGLIWIIFLGGAILVRQDKHVAITFLTDKLKTPQKRTVQLIGDLLVTVILLIMIYQSWRLSGRLTESTTPALSISEAWFGRALIVGFILMFYYKIRRIIAIFLKKELHPKEIFKESKKSYE